MPSSVIASYGYDKEEQILRIVFVSGMIYVYKGVPLSIFESFKRLGSKGIYFNQFIKNRYAFERVNE
ncbi:KTSC domain-containing protein [Niabella sp. CJ426]|uniref:KTSC domain-containing protein n=1 Tax=Niabella sp. CJ426 TaxID=3393740 RepID=UPI003D05D107